MKLSSGGWTHEWDESAELGPAKIYDADGNEIENVAKCNVGTGVAIVFDKDGESREKLFEAPLKVVMLPYATDQKK